MSKVELLAPVGNYKKLITALHFGADAVYLAGKNFGLRAFADNFTIEEITEAVNLAHSLGKKVYITVNIFAKNSDFGQLKEYLENLEQANIDAIIVSDIGVLSFVKKHFPNMEVHISTQANTTNKYSVEFYGDYGASRVVLARELNLEEIREIADYNNGRVELEAFVHGAMCISYSGRCLLSSYLRDRDGNRGECVQSCRWEYEVNEVNRPGKYLTFQEDKRGTYILNSKDMNTIDILDKIIDAGVTSLKVEGRMKSEYYVACVVNAYRKRIDAITNGEEFDKELLEELSKVNHREYTHGFYLGQEAEVCYESSKPYNDYDFVGQVLGYDENKKCIIVEQRNRFFEGEELEVVSDTGVKKTCS